MLIQITDFQPMLDLFKKLFFGGGPAAQNDVDADTETIIRDVENGDAVMIDVRTRQEFEQGAVRHARLIDVTAPDFSDRINGFDRAGTYYVYCRSGNRSGKAMQEMQRMGFAHVRNLGGIGQMASRGFEVVKGGANGTQ
jgi:phage shock protein E